MSDQKPTRDTWYQPHVEELFIALQRLLPQHCASRLLGRVAESTTPWLKNWLIDLAIRQYQIDLEEAEIQDPTSYPSFNAFFTRQLKASARPIDSQASSVVSPADGAISQIGQISNGQVFQAKGRHFSAAALLGCSRTEAEVFDQGSFATVYLSPRDYHRVHMPMAGKLVATTYIPGKLFSVNNTTCRHIDGLFARNERLVCLFETAQGMLAVVLVGALFVAGIETRWQKTFQPGYLQTQRFASPLEFEKGEELGAFRFGSTVVVLTESTVNWHEELTAGSNCQMGRAVGYSDRLCG